MEIPSLGARRMPWVMTCHVALFLVSANREAEHRKGISVVEPSDCLAPPWKVFLHTRVVQHQQRSHSKEGTYSVRNVIQFQMVPDPLGISSHYLEQHSSLMSHIAQYMSRMEVVIPQLYCWGSTGCILPNSCLFAAGQSCLFQFIAQLFPWVRFKVNSRAC